MNSPARALRYAVARNCRITAPPNEVAILTDLLTQGFTVAPKVGGPVEMVMTLIERYGDENFRGGVAHATPAPGDDAEVEYRASAAQALLDQIRALLVDRTPPDDDPCARYGCDPAASGGQHRLYCPNGDAR